MPKFSRFSLVFLRITSGWLYFYAGITKVTDPEWTSVGYIKGAKTLANAFAWFLNPQVLPVVDFLVKWGLVALGVSLLLGLFVRLSSYLGILLMLLFYLPVLSFPMAGAHSFIIDEHIIYIAGLLVLANFKAGHVWGLEKWCSNLPICSKYPKFRSWLG